MEENKDKEEYELLKELNDKLTNFNIETSKKEKDNSDINGR